MLVFSLLAHTATLVNGEVEIAQHQVRWDATGLQSGVHMYRLKVDRFVETKKMIFLQ
jgi:hypothetical protein